RREARPRGARAPVRSADLGRPPPRRAGRACRRPPPRPRRSRPPRRRDRRGPRRPATPRDRLGRRGAYVPSRQGAPATGRPAGVAVARSLLLFRRDFGILSPDTPGLAG